MKLEQPKKPTANERLINVISGLENDVFTSKDIEPFFPDSSSSSVSASICNLVRQNVIWRMKRIIVNRKSMVAYTKNSSLLLSDRTPKRGHEDVPGPAGEQFEKNLDEARNDEKMKCLQKENRKLKSLLKRVLSTLDEETVFKLLLTP